MGESAFNINFLKIKAASALGNSIAIQSEDFSHGIIKNSYIFSGVEQLFSSGTSINVTTVHNSVLNINGKTALLSQGSAQELAFNPPNLCLIMVTLFHVLQEQDNT